jgi:hypothetical protein
MADNQSQMIASHDQTTDGVLGDRPYRFSYIHSQYEAEAHPSMRTRKFGRSSWDETFLNGSIPRMFAFTR